jgi:acyl-coenzyme A synthetase/AMP-(fatty) acid ligase
MAKWLICEEITVYVSVPTLFRQFVSTLTGKERFARLRLVNLGGEAVSKRDVDLYKEHFSPDCILATTLASTEVGIFRRYFVDKETRITSSFVPAGYPVEDKEVRLLDDQGNEVGFDRIGEIVVQSPYLSPGYWRKPELTRSKFLPLSEGGDAYVYHTGDLGRMLPDGCLIYVGRDDSQVKVRGHRVEIAEIELALRSLDNIEEAVVIHREDEPGDQRLVAYIVPIGQPAPRQRALRQALADILPGHMMPSAFIMLAALPLTPTGKVDRRQLPKPDRARRELEGSFVPPHPSRAQVSGDLGRCLGPRSGRAPRQLHRVGRPLTAGHPDHLQGAQHFSCDTTSEDVHRSTDSGRNGSRAHAASGDEGRSGRHGADVGGVGRALGRGS